MMIKSLPLTSLLQFASALFVCGMLAGCANQTMAQLQPQPPGPPPLSLRQHIEGNVGGIPLTAFGIPLKSAPALQEFYLERNFQPAWHDGNFRLTKQALALIDEIGRMGDDGLRPEDYHYSILREQYRNSHERSLDLHEHPRSSHEQSGKPHETESNPPADNYVELDLLLSDAAAHLSQHLLAGKVDPESLSPEWKARRRERDVRQLLTELADASDLAGRIQLLRPQQVRYFRLQKLLQDFFDKPAPEWPPLAVSPAIKPKMTDARMPLIRERLIYWGDLPLTTDAAGPTELQAPGEPAAEKTGAAAPDLYDETLQQAVRRFQQRHGLDADGVMGRMTLEALNVTPATRREQIVINMERWRWLAEDLGQKHLLVNIAGFELKGIIDNRTVLRKPVIVGRHYRRTPVFSDAVRYIVFNPTWTVPYKLAVQDKLPDIQKDPDYLTRLGFTVYDQEQNVVDPATVDWTQYTRRNFPYRLVQAPGPQNALGQVKFMFPNPYDVYLHDTPTRDLFEKSDRAFSSGCVRVAEPLELATWLLEDEGYNREQIEQIIAKGELRTVFLKKPVPVHIEYWTAWIDSEGILNFRNDIYQRDPALIQALAAPLYTL